MYSETASSQYCRKEIKFNSSHLVPISYDKGGSLSTFDFCVLFYHYTCTTTFSFILQSTKFHLGGGDYFSCPPSERGLLIETGKSVASLNVTYPSLWFVKCMIDENRKTLVKRKRSTFYSSFLFLFYAIRFVVKYYVTFVLSGVLHFVMIEIDRGPQNVKYLCRFHNRSNIK